MARLPTSYSDIDILTGNDLDIIELRAKVLTMSECIVFLGIEESELSENDKAIANRVWNKGRMAAIADAGTKLFSSMQQRGGNVPAMDYLRQMSGTFQAEITPTSGKGFKFNVIIDPEDK